MSHLKKARSYLRREGLTRTLAKAIGVVGNRWSRWRDDAMDRKYGIDTRGIVEPHETDHVGEHGCHSMGHEPIQRLLFLKMIKQLQLDLTQFTFVDFGSGKGRAVILAAHFPFKNIVGVEFSPTLDRIARQNVQKFAAARSRAPRIELRCEDAAVAMLPTSPLICFFYNPFGPEVLTKVLDNIRQSLVAQPREVLLIYRNPVHANVFDASESLSLCRATGDYRVYRAISRRQQ
jgi:SAM-dependent methyltransferase